jgi:ABC-type branched-subunit amino acid transport system substrate-binding protein
MKRFASGLLVGAVALGFAGFADAETQGVSDSEVVIGTHQDLSGPITFWGVPVKNGMQMAVDDINAAGGIHGRTLRLVVEDSGYDPKKAVLATQKLLSRDKVFAMVGQMGTPTVMAAMPLVLKQGVPHLFPLTAAEQMYEPFDKLKFSLFTPYIMQSRTGTLYFIKNRGKKAICALHQDDEFGLNVMRGAEKAAEESGMKMVSVTTYKRGATDFSSQVARLRADGCDFVVMGTIIRETIGAMAEAKKIGWDIDMMGTSASYAPEVPALGKEAVEGFYSGGQTPIHYYDTAPEEVKKWMDAYKAKFDKEANIQAIAGYDTVMVTAEGLKNAGKDLTVDSFIKGLEQINGWKDKFGGPAITFGPDRRLATEEVIISQVKNGRWVVVETGLMY